MAQIDTQKITKQNAIQAWQNYVAQNPVKAEAKKAAYFERYGLEVSDVEDNTSELVKESKKIKIKKEND